MCCIYTTYNIQYTRLQHIEAWKLRMGDFIQFMVYSLSCPFASLNLSLLVCSHFYFYFCVLPVPLSKPNKTRWKKRERQNMHTYARRERRERGRERESSHQIVIYSCWFIEKQFFLLAQLLKLLNNPHLLVNLHFGRTVEKCATHRSHHGVVKSFY